MEPTFSAGPELPVQLVPGIRLGSVVRFSAAERIFAAIAKPMSQSAAASARKNGPGGLVPGPLLPPVVSLGANGPGDILTSKGPRDLALNFG